jgi:transcriptional regulator with XRE-family HTH domain
VVVGVVELGQRLRSARVARELSYRDVRASSGVALSYLQRLERGDVRKPGVDVLRRLAPVLGVPFEELMACAGYL